MKKMIFVSLMLCGMATQAHAMDDAERTRQMQVFQAYQQTGTGMVTTTTQVPAGQPMPIQAPVAMAPAAPVQQQTTTTTTTGYTMTTPGMNATMTARSMPINEDAGYAGGNMITPTTPIVPMTAPMAPAPARVKEMSPLNDDGTPMNIMPKSSTLGATTTNTMAAGGTTLSAHDRELKAYEAYKAGQPSMVTTTTSTTTAPMMMDNGATSTTTTDEKTTTTSYTKSSRKVGLVGNHPYPAMTSEVAGGVVTQTSVNGVAEAPQVVVPDPVATLKDKRAEGDYYSGRKAAQVYNNGDVRVHNTGKFNH